MRKRRSSLRKNEGEDVNPLHAVANLFDISIVFAVALMVALVSRYKMTEMLSKDDFTMVKNPGKSNMQIIQKKNGKVEEYKAVPANGKVKENNDKGKRIGTAYQLENGEIIYVPD